MKKGVFHKYLIGICVFTIIIIISSILTFGQITMNSDYASELIYARYVLKHGLFPKNWNYANGEMWTLGVYITILPFSLLINNQVLARELGSACFVLIACLIYVLFAKRLLKDNSYLLGVPTIFLFLFGQYEMNLFGAEYITVLIWSIMFPWLIYEVLEQKNIVFGIMFVVLLLFSSVGGIRIWAEIVIPLFLTLILFYIIKKNNNTSYLKISNVLKLIVEEGLIVFPAIIGLCFYFLLGRERYLNQTKTGLGMMMPDSIKELVTNCYQAIINLFTNFGYASGCSLLSGWGIRNILSICMCIIIMFIIPFWQIKCIRQEKNGVLFFLIFGYVHNLIMFMLVILTSKLVDRYLLSAVYVQIIMSCRFIWNQINQEHFKRKKPLYILWGIITLFYSIILVRQSINWKDYFVESKQIVYEVNNLKLEKGYVDGLLAQKYEVYSNLSITFVPISFDNDKKDIRFVKCLVDSERFENSENKTFLILSEEEVELLGYDAINNQFGEPEQTMKSEDSIIFIYPYDICIKMRAAE